MFVCVCVFISALRRIWRESEEGGESSDRNPYFEVPRALIKSLALHFDVEDETTQLTQLTAAVDINK
jgi:hypothetical protein